MQELDSNRVSFNYKSLEEAIKREILILDILVYPKELINYYIRKIHF